MRTLLVVLLIFSQYIYPTSLAPDCYKKSSLVPTASPQHNHALSQLVRSGKSFRMLTWNVNLMSSWWPARMFLYYVNNQDMNDILVRAQLIADKLKEKKYDVIALQEVGDHTSKAILDRTLGDAGYFASNILGEYFSHSSDGYYLFNGGVTLYSKHPFINLEYHSFSRPAGLQYFMPKGAIYGKIYAHGRMIHLFSLHLQSIQSGTAAEYSVLKSHQIELKKLIESKNIDPSEHAFLLGDFNVDAQNYLIGENRNSEFQDMLEILNAQEVAPFDDCDTEVSFDPDMNPMAKGKTPRGTLDNILCISLMTCPYTGSKRIFRFNDTTTRLKELSDHYPLEALIYLP